MTRPARFFDRFTFGGRIAGAVGLLIALTVVGSLAAAFLSRHGAPLFDVLALAPARVLTGGEVWRLVTWPFIEGEPLSLVFGCIILYFFASDLDEVWGSSRLLGYLLGVTLAAAIGTCAIALVDTAVRGTVHIGGWPLAAALTVAWGMYFPDRPVRLFFVLPIRGLLLAWITIVLTVVYAVYSGWETHLPSLLAMGAMLLWIFRRAITRRWEAAAQARRAARVREERAAEVERRAAAAAAAAGTVRALDELDADEPPPIPPEVQEVLGRILDDAHRSKAPGAPSPKPPLPPLSLKGKGG